jgi:DNA-binding MurR/RpiR family transcriptional regulator
MLGAALLLRALGLAKALQDHSGVSQENFAAYALSLSLWNTTHSKAACEKIAQSISSASQVFYSGELQVVGL